MSVGFNLDNVGTGGGGGFNSSPAFNLSETANAAQTTGTDPMTGFSSQYNPANLGSVIWDNPWSILPDVFQGINSAGPGFQALRDFGADPLTLFNIMSGKTSDMTGQGVGDYTNWLAQLYQNLGTTGGRAFNSQELLSNIFNAGDGGALDNILSSGDAGTQIRTLFNLVREATNAGMNPLAARGYQALTARRGDDYLNNFIGSNANQGAANQGPADYLRQNFGY
jgi:hypothetical protein